MIGGYAYRVFKTRPIPYYLHLLLICGRTSERTVWRRGMLHWEALRLYEDFKSVAPLRSDADAWRRRWLAARRSGETIWGAALDATYPLSGHPEIGGGSR